MRSVAARGFAKSLLIAVPAGAALAALNSPLPWLIGPLLACAAFSMAGAGLRCPNAARYAGQWVIGAALGLYFTPAVVQRIAGLAGWILVGVGWAIVLGLAFAWSIRRFAGTSDATAFFAGAIGGASEMAVQGERAGGRVDQIAAAHSIRLLLVVVVLPFAYQGLGLHGSDPYAIGAAHVDAAGLLALLAATVGGALALRWSGAPNAWVIGPLLVAGALTASGMHWTALPPWVIIGGQVLIGISLGSRFSPEFFAQAPRYVAVVALATLAGIAASALFGWALGIAAGIAPATMILATSPGGIAEMSLTAKNLQLGVPVVTAFHVVRMALLVLTIGTLYRWFRRWRGANA
jgi:uncharacterized protein